MATSKSKQDKQSTQPKDKQVTRPKDKQADPADAEQVDAVDDNGPRVIRMKRSLTLHGGRRYEVPAAVADWLEDGRHGVEVEPVDGARRAVRLAHIAKQAKAAKARRAKVKAEAEAAAKAGGSK